MEYTLMRKNIPVLDIELDEAAGFVQKLVQSLGSNTIRWEQRMGTAL